MYSTILTKVNTVKPTNFGQQIKWFRGKCDFEFLKSFAKLCHPKADFTEDLNTNCVTAFTPKGYYIYKGYSNHIVRTDITDKKKYYAIS